MPTLPRLTPLERFWAFVSKPDDPETCWLWTGTLTHKGYGQFHLHDKMVGAHRFSYSTFVEPIPDGLLILHRCDTPACVNPKHLYAGTHQQNRDDCIGRGRLNPASGENHGSHTHPERLARGENNGSTKINSDQVREIRRLKAEGLSGAAIAIQLNVTRKCVYDVLSGTTWKHVL